MTPAVESEDCDNHLSLYKLEVKYMVRHHQNPVIIYCKHHTGDGAPNETSRMYTNPGHRQKPINLSELRCKPGNRTGNLDDCEIKPTVGTAREFHNIFVK